MISRTRLLLFSRATLKRLGSLGTRLKHTHTHCEFVPSIRNFCWHHTNKRCDWSLQNLGAGTTHCMRTLSLAVIRGCGSQVDFSILVGILVNQSTPSPSSELKGVVWFTRLACVKLCLLCPLYIPCPLSHCPVFVVSNPLCILHMQPLGQRSNYCRSRKSIRGHIPMCNFIPVYSPFFYRL